MELFQALVWQCPLSSSQLGSSVAFVPVATVALGVLAGSRDQQSDLRQVLFYLHIRKMDIWYHPTAGSFTSTRQVTLLTPVILLFLALFSNHT